MRYWVARAPSLVHWPLTVGQGSDGPICNKEGQRQSSCLPSSQTFVLISASQGKVNWGLPAALVLVPSIQASRS